ncbi:class F sortase [Actinomycetospora soli]|uniref:class F sortase n=1 Tax=Actinomycetospora soli TaxID=2893887 RepID=UPI001E59B927|nr:class F sortase [Actinomycetospora soli]MCD2188139.1 class F sortase [Actinomycetospora soli]
MTTTSDQPGADRTTKTPPGRRGPGRRSAVVVGIVVLAVVGVVLVVLGLQGAGTSRSAAPIVPADARAPVAVTGPTTTSAAGAAGVELPASPPRRIDIPAIDVHSAINPVGLNPDRTVQVPAPGPLYDQAAWYTGSASPGRNGPSVILGHIDSAADGPSVFYALSRLEPLDEFTVTRDDGRVITYKVNSVRQYPKDAFPSQDVYGPTTRPEMRLITCGGPFDDSARSYRDNTVVYANQIDPPSSSSR